jgi:hypothetical protein
MAVHVAYGRNENILRNASAYGRRFRRLPAPEQITEFPA